MGDPTDITIVLFFSCNCLGNADPSVVSVWI